MERLKEAKIVQVLIPSASKNFSAEQNSSIFVGQGIYVGAIDS